MRPAPIAERVEEIRDEGGGVVCPADFVGLTSAKNAATQLARLASEGLVRRILRGVYWIAPVSAAHPVEADPNAAIDVDRIAFPSLSSIAEAIARSNHWTIVPSGESALADLDLADAMTDEATFASTGPYASYETESGTIVFRHVADRYIAGLSEATRLFVQVLRSEGRAFATPENARLLASKLTQREADELLEESARLPDWMASFANDVREARVARGKARMAELHARERDQASIRETPRELARQMKELADFYRANPNPAKAVEEALDALWKMPNPAEALDALRNIQDSAEAARFATAVRDFYRANPNPAKTVEEALDALRNVPDSPEAVKGTAAALDQLESQVSAVDQIRESWDSFLGTYDRQGGGRATDFPKSPPPDPIVDHSERADEPDGPSISTDFPMGSKSDEEPWPLRANVLP